LLHNRGRRTGIEKICSGKGGVVHLRTDHQAERGQTAPVFSLGDPVVTEEQAKKLEKLYTLLNICEQRLKQIEHERNPIPHKGGIAPMGLFVPSVNQLRYAFRDALNEIVRGKPGGLDEAIIHAQRAVYDVYEVSYLYVRTKFSNFNYDYRFVELTLTIPSYVEWKAAFDDIDLKLAKISIENRESYYEILVNEITNLKEIVVRLESYRPDLNRKLKWKQRQRIVLLIGAIAALFTITANFKAVWESVAAVLPW
jgi:hypothetical protein